MRKYESAWYIANCQHFKWTFYPNNANFCDRFGNDLVWMDPKSDLPRQCVVDVPFANLSLCNLFHQPTTSTITHIHHLFLLASTCFTSFFLTNNYSQFFPDWCLLENSFLSYLILLYFYFPYETCLCVSLCWFCEMLDRRLFAWKLCRFKLFKGLSTPNERERKSEDLFWTSPVLSVNRWFSFSISYLKTLSLLLGVNAS